MKKYIASTAALLLVTVAISGIAFAGADVYKLKPVLGIAPAGQPEYPNASGHVIVNRPQGKVALIVEMNVRGLAGNTQYQLYVTSGGGWLSLGFFTTKANGTGRVQLKWLKGDPLMPVIDSLPTGKAAINEAGWSKLMS